MVTIAQAVREVLSRSPFLLEVLHEELANTTQVARKIRPTIEKRLREKVTDASIAVAIHRLTAELQKPQFGTTFIKQLSNITVRSSLVEYIFPNGENLHKAIEKLSSQVRAEKNTFFTFSQGLYESTVILPREHEQSLLSLIKTKRPKKITDLSAITLQLPETSLSVPGVYYPILKALALAGINFVEIVSINTELSILFTDTDIEEAFATIKQLTA